MITLTAINKTPFVKDGKISEIRVTLPAKDETLREMAEKIGLEQFVRGNHGFRDLHIDGCEDVSRKIMKSTTVCELNLLAYKLDAFDDQQRKHFTSLTTGMVSISGLGVINMAYYLEKGFYQFIPDAHDYSNLAAYYEKDDLERVRQDIKCGYAVFTPSGFVPNFHEQFNDEYHGANLNELLHAVRLESPLHQENAIEAIADLGKPSILAQIRKAEKNKKQPTTPNKAPSHKKTGPEL